MSINASLYRFLLHCLVMKRLTCFSILKYWPTSLWTVRPEPVRSICFCSTCRINFKIGRNMKSWSLCIDVLCTGHSLVVLGYACNIFLCARCQSRRVFHVTQCCMVLIALNTCRSRGVYAPAYLTASERTLLSELSSVLFVIGAWDSVVVKALRY
jgi:hypothetical protein